MKVFLLLLFSKPRPVINQNKEVPNVLLLRTSIILIYFWSLENMIINIIVWKQTVGQGHTLNYI